MSSQELTVGPKTALWLPASQKLGATSSRNQSCKNAAKWSPSFLFLPLSKQSLFYSLFLLLKTDTDSAFWISESCISSLVLPFLQKSSATSVIFSAPALLSKEKTKIVAGGSFKRHQVYRTANLRSYFIPEEYEDGLPVRHPIQKLIVVQEWLDGVNESCVHFIHFIKYEEWSRTDAHISPNPRLQLILRGTTMKDAKRICVEKIENSTSVYWPLSWVISIVILTALASWLKHG